MRQSKVYLAHVLSIPVITFLVANAFTLAFLKMISGTFFSPGVPVFYVISAVMGFYGVFLNTVYKKPWKNLFVILGAVFFATFLSHLPLFWPGILFAQMVVLVLMRLVVLQKPMKGFAKSLAYSLVACAAALFLFPLGLGLAVMAFLTVLSVADVRDSDPDESIPVDRFEESWKVASKILSH